MADASEITRKELQEYKTKLLEMAIPRIRRYPEERPETKLVDLRYPSDSGLQEQYERQGYALRWSSRDKLARKIDLEGWEYVYENSPDGKRYILQDSRGELTLIAREVPPSNITTDQKTGVPLVDIELSRVKASPEFAQFEIQFAYDIIMHNRSSAAISNIRVVRTMIPDKNRQRMLVHQPAQVKLKPFQKTINVLGPAEGAKLYREHSSSYEFMRVTVTYNDQYDKAFRCTFEGDRGGLHLMNKERLGQTNDRIVPPNDGDQWIAETTRSH